MSWSTAVRDGIARRALPGTDALVEGSSDIVDDTRRFFTTDLVRRIALHRRLSCDSVERGSIWPCHCCCRHWPILLPGHWAPAFWHARLRDSILRPSRPSETASAARARTSRRPMDRATCRTWSARIIRCRLHRIARTCRLADQEAKLLVGLVGWILMSQLRLEQRRQELSPSGLAYLPACNCGKSSEAFASGSVGALRRLEQASAVSCAETGHHHSRITVYGLGVGVRAFSIASAHQQQHAADDDNVDRHEETCLGENHQHLLATTRQLGTASPCGPWPRTEARAIGSYTESGGASAERPRDRQPSLATSVRTKCLQRYPQ